MADKVTSTDRSRMMAAVRNKDTKPELLVRRALFAGGYRYRLHRRDLPGSPDIVLPRFGTVVFVHGCFWHGHDCPRGRKPASNVEFWNKKLEGNKSRDLIHLASLEKLGWAVVIIWECEITEGIENLLADLASKR